MIAITETDNFSLPPSGVFLLLFIIGLTLFFIYFFSYGLIFADRKMSKAKTNIAIAIGAFMLIGSFALGITSMFLDAKEERTAEIQLSPDDKAERIELL